LPSLFKNFALTVCRSLNVAATELPASQTVLAEVPPLTQALNRSKPETLNLGHTKLGAPVTSNTKYDRCSDTDPAGGNLGPDTGWTHKVGTKAGEAELNCVCLQWM
jgi:hypothetical protein